MTWLNTVGVLASLLEQRSQHWICYLQFERGPLVRHPVERDHSAAGSFLRSQSTQLSSRIRCAFAANPQLVRNEKVPENFFSAGALADAQPSVYLIPFFASDSRADPHEAPCLQWSYSDFIELTAESDLHEPRVRSGGNYFAGLKSFADVAALCERHLKSGISLPEDARGGEAQKEISSHNSAEKSASQWTASDSPDALRGIIDHLQNGMRRGDYYLANATTRLLGPHSGGQRIGLCAFVKEWLSAPVRHGVFVDCGADLPQVCCFSPERFILRRGALVQTEPIKGTAAFDSAEHEAEGVRSLWASQKEMSEQTLVTDLLRNDLNKVCQAGSVVVSSPFEIYSGNSLLQMQSVICGRLREADLSNAQLLASLLPAGSVTGTPKWAVSREICNIESTPRGYYTGVFAWAPAADELDSTVLIRGFFNDGKRWTAGLGAGITTLSDPLAEVRELDLKWQSFSARWKRMCDSSVIADSSDFALTEKSSRSGL
ncbi:MAG: hypothetical protein RL189_1795 [Pseudomonadota bacterium]|jgi:hypothetical protein